LSSSATLTHKLWRALLRWVQDVGTAQRPCALDDAHHGRLSVKGQLDDVALTAQLSALNSRISTTLMPVRDSLVRHVKRSEAKVAELRSNRDAIFNEMKRQFEMMVGRLDAAVARKRTALDGDLEERMRDLDAVDSFLHHVNALSSTSNNDVFALLSQHRDLMSACTKLAERVFSLRFAPPWRVQPQKPPIDVPVDDLPRDNLDRADQSKWVA
jgi:hypothetical protein